MTDPFATVPDLELRWRSLADMEADRASALLDDASTLIRDLASDVDERIAAGTLNAGTPKAIVCAMVKRAMQGPAELDGVTQHQQTAGPFQQGVTFANPSGDLYLTKAEKRRLGIGQQRASFVDLIPDESSSSSSSSS